MSLHQQIEADFIEAFKNKDEARTSLLRLLKSSIINKKIEKKIGKEEILPDDEVIAVLKSEIKKRQDSAALYLQGNRPELAEKENAEIALIEKYLPEQLSEEAIKAVVSEVIGTMGMAAPSDFGKVIGAVMAKVKGQADGQMVSRLVKEQLNK